MKIALLGAESTGKSTLAQQLVRALQDAEIGVTGVAEYLREWCVLHKRTPQPDEQTAIAHEQARRIDTAPSAWVVSDSAPLMTAVYSDVLFNDLGLYDFAIAHLRSCNHILVTGLDLPWVADGFIRDGVGVQQKIHDRLLHVLQTHQLTYTMVYGHGAARTQAALRALHPAHSNNALENSASNKWLAHCENCSDASCEHRIFLQLLRTDKTV